MKKILLTMVTVMLIIGMTGCGCSKKPSDNKKPDEDENEIHGNINEGVIKDQEVGGLTNNALVMENGSSQLTSIVTNPTDQDIVVDTFGIIVKDAEGNVITTLEGFVGGVVPAHESRNIVSSCTIDLSHATSIEYVIKN